MSLIDLVDRKYILFVPVDPITESDTTWVATPSPNAGETGIRDVHSGAAGTDGEGKPYAQW